MQRAKKGSSKTDGFLKPALLENKPPFFTFSRGFSGAFFVYLSLFLSGGRQKKHEKSTRKSTRKSEKNTQSNQRGRERSLIFFSFCMYLCASKVLNLEGFAGLGIKIKFTV